MTEQDKTALLERGRDCLAVLDAVLDRDLKGEDFDSANILAHEYIGAAMMLHGLELISGEEYYAWTEGVRSRYLRSRYPKTYPGEEPGP